MAADKIIFSKTIHRFDAENTRVENGDLLESVTRLKQQDGRDIMVYGGASFVTQLIKNKLIDEYYFQINPKAMGQGLKIFDGQWELKFVRSVAFSNGVIANQYTNP